MDQSFSQYFWAFATASATVGVQVRAGTQGQPTPRVAIFFEMDGRAHPLCLRSPNAMTMSCFACRASSLDFQGRNCKKITP
jgi:hypothetical protein